MPAITATDQFFGLGPADWIEMRWGDRHTMLAAAGVRDDDGSVPADGGQVLVADTPTEGAWRIQLQAREVAIEGTTTPGTRTQSGGREGQTITLTSVLGVAPEDMPTDPTTGQPYPTHFEPTIVVTLPPYQAWASGTQYAEGTPASHGGIVWRCTVDHRATDAGGTGPPSAASTYWEPDPRVGRFSFLSPVSRQENPPLGSTTLPGLVVWMVMSQGEVVIHRVLYGVLFRPGAPV